MELRLFLIAETKDSTISALYVDGVFFCFILEDGPRENKVFGATRVDAGGPYILTPVKDGKFFKKYSVKYGHLFAIHVGPFPRHKAIMIHMLNEITETDGCFGPGLAVGRYLTKPIFYVRNSEAAYLRLYDALEKVYDPAKNAFKEDVVLYIHRETPWQLLKGEQRIGTY